MRYLQSGGNAYYSSEVNYAAQLFAAEDLAKTTSLKSSSDDGLISEKLMLKLLEKGIPVDVDNFMNKLADLETDIANGWGVNKRTLRALLADANRIIQLAEYLKTAEENAVKKESLGEIAVGGRGQLYVGDETGIKLISAAEYNFDKHGSALTVGLLIDYRKFAPTEVGNFNLTRVINDNIGTTQIHDYLKKVIDAVGSAETTQEAYIDLASYIGKEVAKKPTVELLESLRSLSNLANSTELGEDAIFKTTDSYKSKNLEAGLLYIVLVLPRDIKLQLTGRHVAEGGKYEMSTLYLSNLILSALYSSNDTKVSHGLDYAADINTAAGTKAGTAKDQNKNLGVMQLLIQGSLGLRDYKLINKENPELSLNLHGNSIGSLATFNNNIIGKTPLSLALDAVLAPLIDEQHIMMGNQKVSSGMLDTILYDGGEVLNVWAPTDANGDINLELLTELSYFLEIFNNNPQLTTEDKNQILQEHQLPGYYDDKGIFHGDPSQGALFLIMTGVTSDEVIDDDLNPFVDEITGDNKQSYLDLIERIYGRASGKDKGDAKIKFKTGWFDFSTHLYKVPIFMRLGQTAQIDVNTFSDRGPIVRTPSYQEQLAYDLILNNQSRRQLIIPTTSALYE